MPRDISPTLAAYLAAGKIRPINLVAIQFSDGWARLTNALREITWQGETYYPAGNLLTISGVEESLKLLVQTVDLRLSGITSSVKALVLNQDYIGNESIVYTALCDSNWEVIDEPFVIFRGQVDSMQMVDSFSSQTAEITLPVCSIWARFDELSGRQTNDSEQRRLYPGDAFFSQTASLSDKELDY